MLKDNDAAVVPTAWGVERRLCHGIYGSITLEYQPCGAAFVSVAIKSPLIIAV